MHLLDKDPGPPEQPLTDAEWRKKIDAAKAAGDAVEAQRLRRQRYLQRRAEKGETPQSLEQWEKSTYQVRKNAAKGRAAETKALDELGIPNNNTLETAKDGKIRTYPDPPIKGEPSCRPDGVTDSHWVDIKATNQPVVYRSDQQNLERMGAQADGGKKLGIVIVTDVPKGGTPGPRPSKPLSRQATVVASDGKGNWWRWSNTADGGKGGWKSASEGDVKGMLN